MTRLALLLGCALCLASCAPGLLAGSAPDAGRRSDGGAPADGSSAQTPDSSITPSDARVDGGLLPAIDAGVPAAPDLGPVVVDAGPAPDACATRDDGAYCDGNDVLRCAGRRVQGREPCANGCLDRAGATDACLSDATEPCFNDPQNGGYCGESNGGTPGVLYRCENLRTASMQVCPNGCLVRPPGISDECAPPASAGGYRLPLECGRSATVSQGNNGGFSHTGFAAYAFDFSLSRGTPMVAMESGTVSRVKNDIRPGNPCWSGGGQSCANSANYVIVSHADGTDTIYLHLDEARVSVGQAVARGEVIALSGGTGWSTGPHAHVQRQGRCGSYWCQSVALSFTDVSNGVPTAGQSVTSGNCR